MSKKISLQRENDLTVQECFEEYIDRCTIRNLSEETVKLYRNQFIVFCRTMDNPDKLIREITLKDIDRFILTERRETACNEITINSYLRGVRAFLYYAMNEGYLERFQITIPKANKKVKETYQDSELAILLKKPNLKKVTFSEYKIWVFSNYLLATGNRISSALNVKIGDLDFRNRLIQVNKTKNRKGQIIPMSDALAVVLREYLKYRQGGR